jgi:bile-salt sulfotransferase
VQPMPDNDRRKMRFTVKNRLRRLLAPPLPFVASHPRSGTHLLLAYLRTNFYPDVDLDLRRSHRVWGHWADRQAFGDLVPNGLFRTTHEFPSSRWRDRSRPTVYIFRDGRAVALSLWRSSHFVNPAWEGITLAEFLRRKLDWEGTPGRRSTPRETIAEHWSRHVCAWHSAPYPRCVTIRYEELVLEPERVLERLQAGFRFLRRPKAPRRVEHKVGIAPNQARIDAWKEVFTPEDVEFFESRMDPRAARYLWPS